MKKILIIEDDKDLQEELSCLLERNGYATECVRFDFAGFDTSRYGWTDTVKEIPQGVFIAGYHNDQ